MRYSRKGRRVASISASGEKDGEPRRRWESAYTCDKMGAKGEISVGIGGTQKRYGTAREFNSDKLSRGYYSAVKFYFAGIYRRIGKAGSARRATYARVVI